MNMHSGQLQAIPDKHDEKWNENAEKWNENAEKCNGCGIQWNDAVYIIAPAIEL